MTSPKTLCFVAGKSGGHIVPCITLAQQYKEAHPNNAILFFTTQSALDKTLVTKGDLIDHPVYLPLTQLYPRPWYRIFINSWHAIVSFCISLKTLYTHTPTKIVTTGGFIAIPVCYAAKILQIPIELIELNAVPGSTIKFLAPIASRINSCFKKSAAIWGPHRGTLIPYPIRFSSAHKKESGIPFFKDCHKTTLLILGGSQGSHFINTIMTQLITDKQYPLHSFALLHQTGSSAETTRIASWYTEHNIIAHVFSYDDDMAKYYQAADIIICRAGAGTLFEALFFNTPCITIPLETDTNDHQLHNAQEMVVEHQRLFTLIRQKHLEKNPLLLLYKLIALQETLAHKHPLNEKSHHLTP